MVSARSIRGSSLYLPGQVGAAVSSVGFVLSLAFSTRWQGGSQQFQLCGPGSGERLCSLWPACPIFRAHPLSSHRHPANRVIVVWSGISSLGREGPVAAVSAGGRGLCYRSGWGRLTGQNVAAGDRRALPCPVPCTLSPVWWASIGTDCCAFKNARGKSVAPLRSPLGLPTPWLQEPAP